MSSLKKNIIYQSLFQILQVITPLITAPYISRTLGVEKIGVYNYCHSVAYLFGIFALLGLENYGNRSIARIKKDDIIQRSITFYSIYKMQLMSSVVVIIFYIGFVLLYGFEFKYFLFIELLYLLSVSTDISWFFFGLEEFKTTALRSGGLKLLMIFLILILVKSENDLGQYTFIMAGGSLGSSIILWPFLKGKIVRVRVKTSIIKQHLVPNLILFIPVVSLALFHYMDKVMLGHMSTMAELGYYSNADKIVNIPLGVIQGIGIVMMPRIASLIGTDSNESIDEYINNSVIYSMWIGSALCFGIIGISKDFVPFFLGEGFDRCSKLLVFFAPVILIKAWAAVFRTQCLVPFGMDREFNTSVAIAAVVNISFNWITIPYYGAVGAVCGTLIAELVIAILYTYYARKTVKLNKNICRSLYFLVIGLIMLICVRLCSNLLENLNIIIRILIELFVGGAVYLLLSVLYYMQIHRSKSIIT